MNRTNESAPEFTVGDEVPVHVHRFLGEKVVYISYPVLCRIAYVNKSHGRHIQYVAVLLADVGYGWYKGDTIRVHPNQLNPDRRPSGKEGEPI